MTSEKSDYIQMIILF